MSTATVAVPVPPFEPVDSVHTAPVFPQPVRAEFDCELHQRPYRSGCPQCGIIPLCELYPPSGAESHSR